MGPIEWHNSALTLTFRADADRPVRLVDIRPVDGPATTAERRAGQPIAEVLTPQWGNQTWGSSARHSGTRVGTRLRYASHRESTSGQDRRLEIVQQDTDSGLQVTSVYTGRAGVPAIRTETVVTVMPGAEPVRLWAVTSLATGAVISEDPDGLDVWSAETGWSAENRWSCRPLRSAGLITIGGAARGETVRDSIEVLSVGTWSSGARNPAGAVQNRDTGRTLAWQVEHNGGWLWEVGEFPQDRRSEQPVVGSAEAAGRPVTDHSDDGAYVAVLGPTDSRHQWSYLVDAEHPFTSVPVTFTVADSFDDAFGSLAAHRRAARRPHPQNTGLPVIFNDYMDTLEGDPTEAKLLGLIDAAAEVGCDYFCIDAGWYDDTAGWWASVGDWQPSTARFPRGLRFVLDHIRGRGLVPGLWMEPEVVGVTSRAAVELPDSAFLQRDGIRIRERDRYLLDLRSPAATAHLDAAVDRLVGELGVGYFKFDYNVTPGPGTDLDAPSVGHGLLAANRAHLAWLDRLLDRHPDLVVENCASGAMRSDFSLLSRLQLQSTSDQQDPLLYPAIAAGALVHVLPEQAGNWAYPQATMTDEEIVFTMCTGLAGRLYQAGLIDRMDPRRRDLVAAGVAAHKSMRADLTRAVPRFPAGLPSWDRPWTSVLLDCGDVAYLVVWRQRHAPRDLEVELGATAIRNPAVAQLYPPAGVGGDWSATVDGTRLRLQTDDVVAAARVYRITGR